MDNLLEEIVKEIDKKLGENIVIIDFRNHSPFVDYFVIADAKNYRHAKSLVDAVEDKAGEYKVYKKYSSNEDSKWLVIDLNNIICHFFYDNERATYNLEGLWKDLPTIRM